MNIEEDIATKLRNALEWTYEKHELDMYYPFNNFPYDCCKHTCDISGNLLLAEGIGAIQINGRLKNNRKKQK